MATKMRLQRFGKKRSPFYHIVIADGRAPRDGRFIEKIGTYNPIPNPAEIKINFDKALDWLQKGAQPTETMRAILTYKGVLYKHHLIKGLNKGALTEAEVEAKFQNWLKDKEAKVEAKLSGLLEKERNEKKAILDAETKINEDRAAELAKRKADEIEAQVKESQEATSKEEPAESEAPAEEEMITKEAVAARVAEDEAPKTDDKAEVKEEPKEEVKAEVKEEPKAKETPEVKEEPKAEAKKEPKTEKKPEVKVEAEEKPKKVKKETAKEEKKEEPKEDEKKESKE